MPFLRLFRRSAGPRVCSICLIHPAGGLGYNVFYEYRGGRGRVLRILFFGLPAGVSAAVLAGLLDDGAEIAGVVVPAASVPHLMTDAARPFAYLSPPTTIRLPLAGAPQADTLGVAWSAGLPALAVRDFEHPDTLVALSALDAHVACVACFTRRIPAAVLRLPRQGFLNLHPSLLPHYRGPEPLFWQLRDGAPAGVTVHTMDEGLDTGDIAAQAAHALPDGISGPEAERRLMLAGLDLLRGVLADLSRGIVRRRPQPPGGSYHGFPTESDFVLSTVWPARRAFNFMRGTADYRLPYRVEVGGATLWLGSADSYSNESDLAQPLLREGDDFLIRFNPGVLRARANG